MQRYPIGAQNFKKVREGGFLYVDKTRYIVNLLEGSRIYFLGRPRRFGKSLFLSTLEYFFQGERSLFRGLAIDSYDQWDWEPHPVIHIDFSVKSYQERGSLKNFISFCLEKYEELYEVKSTESGDIYDRFNRLIQAVRERTGKQVIILIDEYEKPVTDLIDDPKLMDEHREILRGFYSVIKGLDAHLKFVFLTGVTKLGQMSIFSGLNNILDISLLDEYGAICGITEEELTSTFREGIEKLARVRNMRFDEALAVLKKNYDGYHFSAHCPDLFNPFSLINVLASSTIDSFWAITGTPTLLVKQLLKYNYNIRDISNVQVERNELSGIHSSSNDPIALFYQTGYLTIKGYNVEDDIFTLGFPNMEVESAFLKFLLPYYCNSQEGKTASFYRTLAQAFRDGDPAKAMETLEEFSASISYDIFGRVSNEKQFQMMIYIICRILLPQPTFVKVEERTSDGRIDLLIATHKYVYVIEMKCDGSPEKALQQIKEKNYGLQFRHDERKCWLIGVNFSTVKRRIDGFIIEPLVPNK